MVVPLQTKCKRLRYSIARLFKKYYHLIPVGASIRKVVWRVLVL